MKNLEHIKHNKADVDYLYVSDITLKDEKIKCLKDVYYTEKKRLEDVINELKEDIKLLETKIDNQEKLIKEQKEFLKLLERGLNLR